MEIKAEQLHQAPVTHLTRKFGGSFMAITGGWFFLMGIPAFFHPSVGGMLWEAWSFIGLVIGVTMWTVPIRWRCPECGERIHANEPWRCGACRHEHKTINIMGYYSILGKCANQNCKAKPTAYECQNCRHLMYLTKDKIGLRPARSLNPMPEPRKPTFDDTRITQDQELESKRYTRRHLKADQKQLVLEIENARLRRTLHEPEPEKLTPRQERVNWIADQIDEAELSCKTIADTVERELKVHAQIETKTYHPDPKVDAQIKVQMKDAFSVSFEKVRLSVGGDVQVKKKDYP